MVPSGWSGCPRVDGRGRRGDVGGRRRAAHGPCLGGADLSWAPAGRGGAGPPTAHAWSGLTCRGPARVVPAPIGTWYRLDPRLDGDGALAGQTLSVGTSGGRGAATLDLARESFAAGPFGGSVVFGSDDGA